MTIADRYVAAARHVDQLMGAVGPDDWRRPTPCADWDVTALVHHLVDEQRWATPLLEGLDLEAAARAVEGIGAGTDLLAAWAAANPLAIEAAHRTPLDAPVEISRGVVTAGEFLEEMFADQLIHAWDLAAAVDAPTELPPDLVAACADWFERIEPVWRAAGAIAERPEIPDTADAQTRLLAAFGRTHPWSPPS